MPSSFSVLNSKIVSSHDPALSLISSSLVIYEVIRVISGVCLFVEDHLDRLFTSAGLAGKYIETSKTGILQTLNTLISANSLQNGNIRLDIYFPEEPTGSAVQLPDKRNTKFVNIIASIYPHHYPLEKDYREGVKAISYLAERNNPNAKILNPVLREKINLLLKSANAWEAILVNHQGFLSEGSKSNIFFLKSETVYTPPVEAVLPGITREHIIRLCAENSLNIIERIISLDEINQFDSAFISGTSPKILPLKRIDNCSFDTKNNLMRNLISAYDDRIDQYIKKTIRPPF